MKTSSRITLAVLLLSVAAASGTAMAQGPEHRPVHTVHHHHAVHHKHHRHHRGHKYHK